jgi:putative acetyltransferase
MTGTYRLASPKDAPRLFDLRRRSISALAPKGMTIPEAESWASNLALSGMERKIQEMEIWVAELNSEIAGWGAIRVDQLEGLYIDPAFAGRGIGTGLLLMLEDLMRSRGILEIRTAASSNAEGFYLRHGYEVAGTASAAEGRPLSKRLSN